MDSANGESGGEPSAPAGRGWARSPVILVAAAAVVVGLAVAVAVIIKQQGASGKSNESHSQSVSPSPVAAAPTPSPAAAPEASTTAASAPVTPAPAPAPPQPPPEPQPTRVMNLLAMLDLSRDVIAGEWKTVPAGIQSDNTKYARLALPYSPPAEYDFKIEFTRTTTIEESTSQFFRDNGHECAWTMHGWKGTLCAFNMIGTKAGNVNGTGVPDVPLRPGERHTSVVKVRRTYIEAWLDGKRISRYETDGADLSMNKEWDLMGRPLGIGSYGNSVVFHAIEVAEIAGEGKLLPPRPATRPSTNSPGGSK
jgi:hypothetical protein